MYARAAEEQILLSDACHNILIKVCVATGRIDDGVEVVKEVSWCLSGVFMWNTTKQSDIGKNAMRQDKT
eukprot:scaffold225837_cov51-Prasinocladus_malaysianus.AAC.2